MDSEVFSQPLLLLFLLLNPSKQVLQGVQPRLGLEFRIQHLTEVFDRIRENLKTRRRDTEEVTINNAVNQVLSRTIVTSLTVVLVLIPLTLFGGEVLHDFSLALLWGVIFGTYSSVYVASALALDIWIGLDRRKGISAE